MKDVNLRHVSAACLSGILLWALGCGETTPGENVPLKTVQAECRSLKIDKLKERALAYRNLMIEKGQELVELDKKLAAMDPEIADKGTLEALKAEKERVTGSRGALAQRYGLYLQKLRRRGVDITEFRMPGENSELPAIPGSE